MPASDAGPAPANGAARPRSVALIGPYGSGKSTLFDRMMASADQAQKRPSESRERTTGTALALGHCRYMGDPWCIVDCPGSIEFAYETLCALTAVDMAVIVCEPTPEKALAVAPMLKWVEENAVPHLIFINKIDTLGGRVRDMLSALQAFSTRPLVLRQIPIREGDQVTGYVDVVSERAYRYRKGQASELIEMPAPVRERESEALSGLVEVLADHDDVLLEKIIEDLTPTPAEIYRQLHKDQISDAIVEVLMGAADRDNGIRRLWKALRHDGPDPLETSAKRAIDAEGEPLVQIFKTVHAGHMGKLSLSRVWRGPLRDGAMLAGMRIGGLHRMQAGELVKIEEAQAGELVAIGRLESASTGSALSALNGSAELLFPKPPQPVYAQAIRSADRKDDVKISGALQKLAEEDPALSVTHNAEAGETILHGQGDIHLNAALDRLTKVYKLTLATSAPSVRFKETIRHTVKQHSRLKRQTGGHGQFADVTIEIEPRARGEGFVFNDRIVGGAVPRQYIPAVAEAAEEATRKGPLGYPVVDIAVTLLDGTFHSVDSSDMAFKSATRAAMTEGLLKAEPILLEPIERVVVSVPDSFTASAQRLLTGRRAQILSYAARSGWSGWDDIEALVPAAELGDLIIELRSRTMGIGTYVARFDHLAEARGKAAERAVHQAAARS